MADSDAPSDCPHLHVSYRVILGTIWGVVIPIIALVMIGNCWYKDRKQQKELREARIWQQHLQNTITLRVLVHRGTHSPPPGPPPYQQSEWYDMDNLDQATSRAYDTESQMPNMPVRAVLSQGRGSESRA
jgi:hypothetical protein